MKPGTLPTADKLVIYRGTADSTALTFTDTAGDPIDLSGKTFTAQVRKSHPGDVVLEITVANTNLAGGVITLSWTAALTRNLLAGDYLWGLLDSDDILWIEDTCTIKTKTPFR